VIAPRSSSGDRSSVVGPFAATGSSAAAGKIIDANRTRMTERPVSVREFERSIVGSASSQRNTDQRNTDRPQGPRPPISIAGEAARSRVHRDRDLAPGRGGSPRCGCAPRTPATSRTPSDGMIATSRTRSRTAGVERWAAAPRQRRRRRRTDATSSVEEPPSTCQRSPSRSPWRSASPCCSLRSRPLRWPRRMTMRRNGESPSRSGTGFCRVPGPSRSRGRP